MAGLGLNLQRIPSLFKQAAISFRANIKILLVIAALSSMYDTAIENSIGMAGFSFSISHGNFSLDFDFQDKQNHISPDSTSGATQRQKLFVDGNNNAIVPGGQAGQNKDSSIGHFLPSYFVPPSVDEANGHLHELIQGADERTFSTSPVETNDGHRDKKMSSQAEDQGKEQSIEHVTTGEDLANDNSDTQGYKSIGEDFSIDNSDAGGPHYMNLRLIFSLGNDTQKEVTEDLEESEEVGIFAGRLFGGRGFDHPGAMPQGTGTTMLLILLLFGVMATLLVVVALQHSAVLGAVAYSVVTTYMNKRVSIRQSVRSGLRTGMWRLIWLAVLHGSLRALQCLFLMKSLFGKVLELEEMEKLVLRLSTMPFAFQAPWKDEFATDLGMSFRIGAFISLEYLIDGLAYSIYITACWVAIMERQYRGAETLHRGWNLVKSMAFQAATIKVLESVVCGRSFKWVLQQVLGHFLATLIVSFIQSYFLVLWLVFYFSARAKESQGHARQFTERDLEDFHNRLR
ncbi:hypothetical protein SUGI_0761680 [Cryptomeria japonica]|uniref:uncharacterized protein LOC131071208 n=1 Tax=Cryptomeria japonica TaxID=3369 RepID=UPI002414A4F9|nr:uncharacterized protein LOC131071208 [Cryptomeria japonica]XP_057862934.2 uncharacterized protein LOC131071208 [Cryptomeria japonica]GLJ37491.1 hypothetical protein SUGI_0761680 [Cryptomeria japonica]